MQDNRLKNRMLLIAGCFAIAAVYSVAGREDMVAQESIAATTAEVEQAGIVYSNHKAYRLATPTPDQMDYLEDLRAVQRGRSSWYAAR